ncbi:MAG: hypothetical protein LBE92_21930 [Chryseobacterium sp.]|jgi:hypothetical protein|uniref:hypothetical protein n=1 Tax=Chryseobacterium sp. TaxID=1871047 RepID=UPI002830AB52|nr:hypothetical protein [Chryseobacterium sp.]MDR2238783.1 hypothetical protein [Chryseobacterium sp.]
MHINTRKNEIFKSLLISFSFLLVLSCQKKIEDSVLYKLFNPKYTHDTISTVNMPDNLVLIDSLYEELEKNDVEVTSYITDKSKDEYNFIFDCVNLVQYHINMKGMRTYSIKAKSKRIKYNRRTKMDRSNKTFSSYYYNFHIRIYEFENDEIAQKQFEILDKASRSGEGFCNRSFNIQLV